MADLRYRLFDGVLPPDQFPVLVEQPIVLPWAEVTLRIVGASHTCEVVSPDWALTETLVGRWVPDGAAASRVRAELAVTRDAVVRVRAGPLVIESHLIMSRPGPAALRALDRRLGKGSQCCLVARYPAAVEPAGLTAVRWQARLDAFALLTYHAYPEEGALVRTWTRFQNRGAR